jgi:hypothetical protein
VNSKWQRKYIFSMIAIASCLMWSSSALAQLKTSLSSSPADYLGNCPGVITFNGTITSDKAQTVTYIFTRSDNATDTQPKTLVFKKAGSRPVSTTWTLGGDGLPYYVGWEAVKITKPAMVESNHAEFHLRCNPPLNSVLAAHGNTDWHIDTANEFLFGKNMSGAVTAAHHAPDTWSKMHIHVNLTNTAKYYYDKSLISTGADTNIPNGIDRTMLFFYAGHGNATGWSALGDFPGQADVRLANLTGGGNLRYYWQCSCEVFAHGPETCSPATTFDYACPNQFNGAADSASMRNVYQRWGPALTPDLRMACGGSTEMYCHTEQVDRAWSDYSPGGGATMVVQMFLDGFGEGGAYGVVPLCMTLGGNDITKTPLYDTNFTNAPNTSGSTHYYLMYALSTGTTGTQAKQKSIYQLHPEKVPLQLQKYKLLVPPPPPKFRRLARPGATAQIRSALVAGGKAKVERIAHTGALHVTTGQLPLPTEKVLAETEYIHKAASFLREQGLAERQTAAPALTRYMTESMPVNGKPSEIKRTQAGVSVLYKQVVMVNGAPVEVLGAPGTIRVHMNNEGDVVRASKLWRALEPVGPPAPAKTFEQARGEAMNKLGRDHGAYQLDTWTLGYKQESVSGQDQLVPVYHFAFIPVKPHDVDHPPQMIDVAALK